MKDKETVVNTTKEYRDHYLKIVVTASPPLPHGDEDDDAAVQAEVTVFDGPPGDMGIIDVSGSSFAGDVVDRFEDALSGTFDTEDAIEAVIERGKERVDDRVTQSFGVRESSLIAVERAFADED